MEGNMKEDFEKWARENGYCLAKAANAPQSVSYGIATTRAALEGYLARQPEIDAIKAEANCIQQQFNEATRLIVRVTNENAALKAENERLRKDAERYQWLKQNPDVWIQVDNRKGKTIYRVVSDGEASGTRHQSYDNALDAAMKEAK